MTVAQRHFCPNCGWSVDRDTPVIINDFSMFADGYPLLYKGEKVPLTAGEARVCWSLLRAFPDHVSVDTLAIRCSSNGFNDTIKVLICRIRRKLRDIGCENQIETIWGMGYRWSTR
jgi:DNA-binding response OmpR family regulator